VVVVLLVALGAVVVLTEAPLCPTAFFWGVPCPGCGLTRATLALVHGHLAEAFAFHPLVLVFAPLFGGALGKALVDFVRGHATPPGGTYLPRSLPPAWWTRGPGIALASALGAVLVGVWLARFAGYFGGPVPVESYHSWLSRVSSR
jgi:hypothetical protein